MSALSAVGLTCAVGRRAVLVDVAFDIEPGQVVGVVGPNGSGKSTLLRALAGITRPPRGRVLVDGEDLHRLPARARARRVAFVGQDEDLPSGLLVREAVALGRVPYAAPWDTDDADRPIVLSALAEVGLADLARRPVEDLSGGERRRVSLARGLAQRAPVLVLDEPTNHLDVGHQLRLVELLRGLDRTVVVALHDLSLAAATCDRLVVVHGGRTAPALPPAEALTSEVVRAAFGVRTTPVTDPHTGRTHLLMSLEDS
ncbi:ABC transporter ATP-binding protein [Actinokineospora sp. PR83]|uniref:ABC transporter ATP-binding protein n=1 Tax=Actinokineospora sp. PR83 TaxID=2884908 RepID=UPI001F258BF6|nr:ABC transporter ATP-binding protein [Actinokineospora sp. PR83]MCG8915279.1 ABC transporter ATP-binding protein [Actinokineospora sp. PR83]